MVVARLDIEIEPFADGSRVCVVGELDIATAPVLAERLDQLGASGSPRVFVDLARVSFIDARGLRILVDAHGRLNAPGLPGLELVCPSRSVRRLFELTGMFALLRT